MTRDHTVIETLLLNLEQRDSLSDAEKEMLRSIAGREKRFSANEDIVTEGTRPNTSTMLLDGFAARYKVTPEGARQITAIHIAGEFVDLHAFLLKTMDHGIVALSNCTVAFVDYPDLKKITEDWPHLTRLLWLDTLIHGGIHREWIVSMGRRSRTSHLAHVICELYLRLKVVGHTQGWAFHFPLSQAEMADVLGISLVHMNRVIQALRRENLITWTKDTITILDWPRLQSVAGFDPTYLSLNAEPR